MRSFHYPAVVAWFAALAIAATALAQFPIRIPREEELRHMREKRQPVKGKGTINAIQGDVFHVIGEEKKQWLVKMPTEPVAIQLQGKTSGEFVQPGMVVRFIADLDSRGKVQQPVQKLDVITIRPPKTGEPPDFPGVMPLGEDVGGALDKVAPRPALAARATTCRIVGQVVKLRKGEMTVNAGGKTVRAELAETAEVTVDIGDFRFAHVGDEIEMDGFCYPPLTSNVYANRVTIRAGKALTAEPAEKPKPTVPAKPRPQPAEKLPF
jgi:urease beta subunit